MGKLDGKVALVSGGARGMGAAEVRRLHADGASVVAGDVLDDEGKALADELGDKARFVHLDVTSEESWQSAVEQTEREFGKLDVLVNNAGILRFNAIVDTPIEELRQVLDVNLIGVFIGMKTAIPAMRRAGGGSIVNISSIEGLVGTGVLRQPTPRASSACVASPRSPRSSTASRASASTPCTPAASTPR